ncbi:MAG TPA: hypothetical protein VGS19_20485, partial [Streptosporangiaceae bacterium]|nr:hypothetical protein [Streptosporangiaceae bacterium]
MHAKAAGRHQQGRRVTGLIVGCTVAGLVVLTAPPLPAAASTLAKSAATPAASLASMVNPFIGTTNGANTFPGADTPFGMIQWSPDTPSRDAGGGYDYSDRRIIGFSLNHLSGPGCGAEGDVPILPTTGTVNTSATDSFSHTNESAQAGYYSVKTANGVRTQLTTTARTGIADFTFPATTQANLILKLADSANGDATTSFNVVSSTEVNGSVSSGAFCGAGNTYTLYFDMKFNHAFTGNGTFTPVLHRGARHLLVKPAGHSA